MNIQEDLTSFRRFMTVLLRWLISTPLPLVEQTYILRSSYQISPSDARPSAVSFHIYFHIDYNLHLLNIINLYIL